MDHHGLPWEGLFPVLAFLLRILFCSFSPTSLAIRLKRNRASGVGEKGAPNSPGHRHHSPSAVQCGIALRQAQGPAPITLRTLSLSKGARSGLDGEDQNQNLFKTRYSTEIRDEPKKRA
jgi:hypothetical protein